MTKKPGVFTEISNKLQQLINLLGELVHLKEMIEQILILEVFNLQMAIPRAEANGDLEFGNMGRIVLSKVSGIEPPQWKDKVDDSVKIPPQPRAENIPKLNSIGGIGASNARRARYEATLPKPTPVSQHTGDAFGYTPTDD